jgi:hypothetical protein
MSGVGLKSHSGTLMQKTLIGALLVALSNTAAAQYEIGVHAAVGQRWQDGGRRFHGGSVSAGVSTRQPGVNIGLRFSATAFDTREIDEDLICIGGCFGPEGDDTEKVLNASVALIPIRSSSAQLEFGAGTSWTESMRRRPQLALLLTAAAAYRVPGGPARAQVTYERHKVPFAGEDTAARIFFRHLVRVGIVYEVSSSTKP